MDLKDIGQDRFLRKDANQSDRTKDAIYTAQNPAPKRGNDQLRKLGRPKGSEEDDGSPNILTGTVIVSCFIQTSALPSRIELQGNDLTFFDDTFTQGGQVIGDTSRLIFTHASGKAGEKITSGFIWEKRASISSTYDNVLSLYGLPPTGENLNFLFFGFEGSGTNFETNTIEFVINHRLGPVSRPNANGRFAIAGVIDGEGSSNTAPNIAVIYNDILGVPGEGYSVYISGTGTGVVVINGGFIAGGSSDDLGSAGNPFRDLYLSGGVQIAGGVIWVSGVGSPETVVTAPPGSLYSNTSGGAGTSLYVKESGVGNTGWIGK